MTGNAKARTLIRDLVDRIVREYRPMKVILFGSYANGTPDEDSDIDLFIIKETTDRPIDRRVEVATIVADPRRRTPVEPLVMTRSEVEERLRIGDQFVQQILDEGEILYEASGCSACR